MKYWVIVLLLLGSFISRAQFGKDPYRFSKQIEEGLKTDTTPWKNQFASYDYSFIGDYTKTLAIADLDYASIKQPQRLSASDSSFVAGFSPVPALQYILQRAAQEQIIIINEAHYQPLHRAFVRTMLSGLYEQGYRYLGIETLSYDDSLLNQRKYPVLGSGYYSREPQFGNMIREALQLGFILFPYETTDPSHNGKEREIDQAHNIVRFMDNHKNGKYLIYCGYDHVVEGPHNWEKAMAGRLKEYTGINPLTINQQSLTEHSQPLYERGDYAVIHAAFPAILVNSKNEVYHGYTGDSSYDVMLFHPRTTLSYGRPSWVMTDKGTPFFIPVKSVTLTFPILVKAYVNGEDISKAVPCDIIELENEEDNKALVLRKGEYILVLEDTQQHTQQLPVSIN